MKRGFTLIELLIVIGILAILATVAVLVLNPAEILRQARDSQRVSDLSSIKSAIALHLATGNTPDTNYGFTGTRSQCTVLVTPAPFTQTGNGCGTGTAVSSTAVSGTGWVNVNLADTSGGAALSALPIDPVNTAPYFYGYAGDDSNNTFEIDTVLESTKYAPMMSNDGGTSTTLYEVGTALNL